MKVIDILVNIASKKEVPQKIKYGDIIWQFNGSTYEDKTQDLDSYKRYFFGKYNLNILNHEIEIIEEKPKKIKTINFRNEKGETLIGANMWEFYYRLNELRNAVNYLLEKSDE